MWYVVTRYKTPTGQIIRHIYGVTSDGQPYKNYSGAASRAKQMLAKAKTQYAKSEWSNMEANAVKVVTGWDE